MSFIIRNIKIKELEVYLASDEYKNSSFVPISRIRALSHVNNPRAAKDDACLFLAYNKEKLIGYLGAITDKMFISGKEEKVFFLSCMWVLPEHRRDGTALSLLKHAYNIFDGKVFITNFIPRSKGAFDRTGQYNNLTELEGIRGYVLFDTQTLFVRKFPGLKPIKSILKIADFVGNGLLFLRRARNKRLLDLSCQYSQITSFDKEITSFIDNKANKMLFRRGAKELDWIKNFPWVKKVDSISDEAKKYYFSQESLDFEQYFIKVEKDKKIAGVLVINIFRGEMKVPYLYYNTEFAVDISIYIAGLIIRKKVKTFIGYDSTINKNLSDLGLFFHKRKSVYGFIAGKKLEENLNEIIPILQYGDGDGAFT